MCQIQTGYCMTTLFSSTLISSSFAEKLRPYVFFPLCFFRARLSWNPNSAELLLRRLHTAMQLTGTLKLYHWCHQKLTLHSHSVRESLHFQSIFAETWKQDTSLQKKKKNEMNYHYCYSCIHISCHKRRFAPSTEIRNCCVTVLNSVLVNCRHDVCKD